MIKKIKIAFPYSLSPTNFPPTTEEIIDGNLAKKVITIKSPNLIGVNAKKYVSKSFGVPGIKKSKNIVRLSFRSVLINLRVWSFWDETNTE